MSYVYTPYPESILRAECLMYNREYTNTPSVVNRIGGSPYSVSSGYFLGGKWNIPAFRWQYDENGVFSNAAVRALATWIDSLPVNVPYIADVTEIPGSFIATPCDYFPLEAWDKLAVNYPDRISDGIIYARQGVFELV